MLEDGEPSLSIALLDTEAPGSFNRSASIRVHGVVQHNVQARAYKPLVQVHAHADLASSPGSLGGGEKRAW